MRLLRLSLAALLLCFFAFGQNPEYEFYLGFRDFASLQHMNHPGITPPQVREAYAAKMKADGVPAAEIVRRIHLLETVPAKLEADRWDRFYKSSNSKYNQAPNAFLEEVVANRKPGVALDYAMGTGRNSLYLAKVGWDVYGFDFSEAAVGMAQQRAHELGLTIHTAAVADKDYDFGKVRFDLVLFSWSMPLIDPQIVIDSLKPGGMVVMECAADYVGRNGMLHKFDALRIVRYEIVKATADFYDRSQTDVLRMIALKE